MGTARPDLPVIDALLAGPGPRSVLRRFRRTLAGLPRCGQASSVSCESSGLTPSAAAHSFDHLNNGSRAT